MFTKRYLHEARREALRRHVWWSALDALERGILTASANISQDIKSTLLVTQLDEIITKIKKASTGIIARRIREFGEQRANEIRQISTQMGSNVAEHWVDEGFARYLAFMSLNAPNSRGD